MTNTTHTPGIDLDKLEALARGLLKADQLNSSHRTLIREVAHKSLDLVAQVRGARQAAPEAPTDDAIEHAALKHVAPGFKQLAAVSNMDPDYRNGEQFKRLKEFAQELFGSAPATQQAGAASDDELIIEAVKQNNVYGVLPNSASTVGIGRAVLAAERRRIASTAATTASASGEPCTTCDGSGSVHRADGEYMGECPCGGNGPAPSRDAVEYLMENFSIGREQAEFHAAALARAPLPAQGEPVAKVTKGTEWGPGLAFLANGKGTPKVGTLLYLAAPAQAGDARDEDGERWRFFDSHAQSSTKGKTFAEWLAFDAVMEYGSRAAAVDAVRAAIAANAAEQKGPQ